MTGPTIFIAGTVIGALTVGIPLVIALFNAQRDIEILSDARDGFADRIVALHTAHMIARMPPALDHDFPSDKDQRHDG